MEEREIRLAIIRKHVFEISKQGVSNVGMNFEDTYHSSCMCCSVKVSLLSFKARGGGMLDAHVESVLELQICLFPFTSVFTAILPLPEMMPME